MNKQIEEMAKALCQYVSTEYCASGSCANSNCLVNAKALEKLYNAGYRKQIEGEWIAKDNFNGRCSIAICSNCGTEKAFSVLVSIETIVTLYPYCQKCGAKMKGK